MEVRKAIRKVAAIGTGAAVAASALTGAFAASLADYPAPFVSNGQFDAVIVVGKDAKADDVIGAVDVGTGLQFAMKKEKTVSTGAPTATTTSGIKIEKTGNHVSLTRNLADVQDSSLTETDLPDILGDGLLRDNEGDNFNEETYTQKLFVLNNSGKQPGNFIADQPDQPVERGANTYVYFDNANARPIYRYQIEFDSAIDYNNATAADARDDLEDNVIEIQGHDYTIAKVETGGNNAISKLTLFSGDTIVWLQQNQPITKSLEGVEHTIEVFDVTEDADSCGVVVDGSQVWVDIDTTEIINGIEIGITDAKVVHAQLQDVDVCQVNVGASKVEISNGDKIKKNGQDLDGSRGYIFHENGNAGKWLGMNVTYSPKKDIYLAPGEAWTDPVFDGFKVQYAGNSAVTENITFKATGSESAELKFMNNDGKEVSIPLTTTTSSWADTTSVVPGTDWDELLLFKDGQRLRDTNGIEGTKLLVVTSGKETHVLEITDVDTLDNETDIEDITYGRSYSDKKITFNANTVIDLGFASITLKFFNETELNATDIILGPYMSTWYDANVSLSVNGGFEGGAAGENVIQIDHTNSRVNLLNGSTSSSTPRANTTITVAEKDEPASEDTPMVWLTRTNTDTDGDEVEVTSPINGTSAALPFSWFDATPDDSDIQVTWSLHGTKATYDNEDHMYLYLEYAEDQLFANIFVTPISAEVTATGGEITTIDLQKINVGAARFDSEVIDDVAGQNLIVIGGPCVNTVAAEVQGQSGADCANGYTDGEAVLKLYDTGKGKVALLVAGYKGQDTRAASRVIGNYEAYASQLKGSEVTVTYTSLSQITVSSPQ